MKIKKYIFSFVIAAFSFAHAADTIATQNWVTNKLGVAGMTKLITASGKLASQQWVKEVLTDAGLYTPATIVTNDNGSITFTGSWSCTNLPSASKLSLTFSRPVVVTNEARRVATRAVSLFALSSPSDTSNIITYNGKDYLRMIVKSGYWIDKYTEELVEFNFGDDGYEFTQLVELGTKPSGTHTCYDLDVTPKCHCGGEGLTDADIDTPDEYAQANTDEFIATYGNPESWIDKANWPKDDITYTGKKKTPHYWMSDEDGHRVDIGNLLYSDAWLEAIKALFVDYNTWMNDADRLYKLELICDKSNPQHDASQTKKCGSHTWGNCARCGANIRGSENHEKDASDCGGYGHRCKCGGKRYALQLNNSSPVYKYDEKGLESGYYIIQTCDTCGWSKMFTHTHKWKYCHGCEEKTVDGKSCDKSSCPWCGGEHDMQQGADGCSRCACRDCGIIKTLTVMGSAHVASRTDHDGWSDCDHVEDGNDYPGVGKHCVCGCGYNGCENDDSTEWNAKYGIYVGKVSCESLHQRADRDSSNYTFEDFGDALQHYAFTKEDCEYCGAKYAVKENHYSIAGDDGVAYKFIDNDHHLKGLKCRDANDRGCGAEYFPDPYTDSNLSPHAMKDGDSLVWEAVTDESGAAKCRSYYYCEKCREKIYDYQDHAADPDNECKCSRGCGYQCEHTPSAELDGCGNSKCTVCASIIGEETHGDAVSDGITHRCACGKHTGHGHIYSSEGVCIYSGWGTKGCGASEPEIPYGHVHKFTDCVCAGDPNDPSYAGCGAACTDCDGKHLFSDPTNTDCAKCQCSGCSATPDDISMHSGWTPCGESDEEANDWPEAKGAHCACQCLKFGHVASTGHDRNAVDYVQALGADAADYTQKHLHVTGKCKRCGWRMASKVDHGIKKDDDGHTMAVYQDTDDGSKCYATGVCDCGYEMTGDPEEAIDHVAKSGTTVYEDNDDGTCTPAFTCVNCNHTHEGEPVEHVRGAECKCKFGCGYQFEHEYGDPDTCGFEYCEHCGAAKNVNLEHQFADGYNEGAGHFCKCSRKILQPHTMVAKDNGGYACSVAGCGFEMAADEVGEDEDPTLPNWGYDHMHAWTNCAPCTVCGVPCRTCPSNGKHNVSSVTISACAKCTCSNCDYKPDGESNHVGWHECSEEDDGEDAHGAHCVCACGYYSHASGHDHDYGSIDYREKKVLQSGVVDPIHHYRTRGKCDRSPCDHEYKIPESHNFDDGRYSYVATNVCRYTRVCYGATGCGWIITNNLPHVRGDVSRDWHDERVTLNNGSETNKCVRYFACANCKHPNVFREENNHDPVWASSQCQVVASDQTKCQAYAPCRRCTSIIKIGEAHAHVDSMAEGDNPDCICDHVGCGEPAHHPQTSSECPGACTVCDNGHVAKCGPYTSTRGICMCGQIDRGHVYPNGRCNCAGYIAGNGCTAESRKDRDEYVVKGDLIVQSDVTCDGSDETTHALNSSGEFECKGCGDGYTVSVYDGTRHCRRCNDLDHPVTSFAIVEGYHTCPEVSEDAWSCACGCSQYGSDCQYKDDGARKCICSKCAAGLTGQCVCCTDGGKIMHLYGSGQDDVDHCSWDVSYYVGREDLSISTFTYFGITKTTGGTRVDFGGQDEYDESDDNYTAYYGSFEINEETKTLEYNFYGPDGEKSVTLNVEYVIPPSSSTGN